MENIQVVCCRSDREAAESDPTVRAALARCRGLSVQFVGARPGKEIDILLTGRAADRLVVLGDDSDLAAVVLRLLRRDLLSTVAVGFATDRHSAVTDLWSLPVGAAAVALALAGEPAPVPLVRDDVGGVLVGLGALAPVRGTVYVDENRVLSGVAARLLVEPDTAKGLSVTVIPRRLLGIGRRPRTFRGRAVQIGTIAATVVTDGRAVNRPMERWTFYRHTESLRLIRGVR